MTEAFDDQVTNDIRIMVDIINRHDQSVHGDLMDYCQSRLADGSSNPYIYMVMAVVSFANQDAGLGLQLLERAHALNPECREVVDVLANLYTRVGRLADGLYYGKLAVCLKPRPDAVDLIPAHLISYAQSLTEVGRSHHYTNAKAAFHLGLIDECILQVERHLRIHPDDVPSMLLGAQALVAGGRPAAAAAMATAALHSAPRDAWLHAILGDALMGRCEHESAAVHHRLALRLADEEDDALRSHVAGSLLGQSGPNWSQASALVGEHAAALEAPRQAIQARNAQPSNLIGALWDQVYDSPLINCVSPVLLKMNNTVLYVLNSRHDAVGEKLRTRVMRPRQVNNIDVPTLGRIVLGDNVCCLINLCAPSALSAFPAFKGEGRPVVVHWINSPMSERLPGADVVLSGPQTADIDERNYGADKVIRLDWLLAFAFPQILSPEEEVTALPRNDRGFAMFGVHGRPENFTPECVSLWAEVLWAAPRAHLMIGGRDSWEPEMTDWALETFAGYGLAERVHFQDPVDGISASAAHLFPHMVDVILDSTPVNGLWDLATDLWMGLPVVTLRGDRRAGRVGASILDAAGCGEWIAHDREEYVAIAGRLAASPDLGTIRTGLRGRVLASRLADTDGLAAQVITKLSAIVDERNVRLGASG